MIRIASAAVALTATLLSALPAAALSCLPPDPVRQYTQARDAEARYRIVHGTLTPLQKIRKHKGDLSTRFEPKPIRIKARLQGMQLGANGFTTPFDSQVDVMLVCFGPWCGGYPGGDQLLMSVEEGEGGKLTVTADPCSSQIFQSPSAAALRAVATCHKGGRCATARN